MFTILIFVAVIPMIAIMIYNGRKGRGYVVRIPLPPKGDKRRLPVRIALLAYSALLFVLVLAAGYEQRLGYGQKPDQAIRGAIFFFIFILLVNVALIVRKRKRQ